MFSKPAEQQPPIGTLLVGVCVIIVVIVGGIVTIAHPSALSFDNYISSVSRAVIGSGLLAVGRGVLLARRSPSQIDG